MIKWLKQLFCSHEFRNFVIFKGSNGNIITEPRCIKCHENANEDFAYYPPKEEKSNFSIVKGMAEAANIYKEHYYKYLNYITIIDGDSFLKLMNKSSPYSIYFDGLYTKNSSIKDKAKQDAKKYYFEKKENEIKERRERELQESIKLQKINSCYLELKHE